jgi:hypothetical protein
MYNNLNDTMRMVHGDRSELELDVLVVTLSKISMDPSSHDFITPPELCALICLNQAASSLLLSEMPFLDDIDLVAQQVGDCSLSVRIPRTGDASARRSADNVSDSGKGKGVATPSRAISRPGSHSPHVDIKVSLEDDIPLQRRRKMSRGSGSAHGGPQRS